MAKCAICNDINAYSIDSFYLCSVSVNVNNSLVFFLVILWPRCSISGPRAIGPTHYARS